MSGRYGEPWRPGRSHASVIVDGEEPPVCPRCFAYDCPNHTDAERDRIVYGGGLVAESVFDEAKRRRIIAAVNACAGIPTALLEEGLIGKLLAGDRAVADNHNDPACPCPSCRLVRRLDEGDES